MSEAIDKLSGGEELAVTVRPARREDVDSLHSLISALAAFENLPGPDDGGRGRLLEYGFGANPRFEAWVAELPEAGRACVGYVILYPTFSTFLAMPGLHLEDLFVLPEYRGRGIGSVLLRHCIELAEKRGSGRLEWTCLDWNSHAQAIYEGVGAQRVDEWIIYRMTGDVLKSAATSKG